MTRKQVLGRVTTERAVTKSCIDFLKVQGWRCFRLHAGLVRGITGGHPIRLNANGTPDYLAVRSIQRVPTGGGYFILFCEFKRPGLKPSPVQLAEHTALRREGFPVIVADSFESFREQYEAL